jgi:hypothetical protein
MKEALGSIPSTTKEGRGCGRNDMFLYKMEMNL